MNLHLKFPNHVTISLSTSQDFASKILLTFHLFNVSI